MLKFKKEQIVQWLVLLSVIIISFGYLGIIQLQEIRRDILSVNNLISKQQSELKEVGQEITQLQKVNEDGLAKLAGDLLVEKEKRALDEKRQAEEKTLAQQQILNLEEKITETEKKGLTNIVNQWEPYVTVLECNFYRSGMEDLFLQSSGSGLLTEWEGTSIAVLTNKHIITAISVDKDDIANECTIKFPQEDLSITSDDISILTNDFDWGIITINFPNEYIKTLVQNSPKLCTKTPNLGDDVAILGYPGIGDQKNVTVTEGIIAGFDEDYFITSAKVEKGNSGGAAVSLKDNCYLGTPTFSRTGEIESLARILDVRVLLK